MDRTRSLGWLELEDQPAVRLGDRAAAATACSTGPRCRCAGRCSAPPSVVLDMTVAVRQGPGAVRPAHRELPGRKAPLRRHARRRGGHALGAYYAAWAVGAGDPDASAAASAAKVWCSDAARRVMASGLQVHGGIGFTWEHDLHLFLKRSQLDQVSFGDATFHRDRLARYPAAHAEAGLPVL